MCPALSTVSHRQPVSALEEVNGANKLMNTVGCERMHAGWPCGWSTALAQRMGCSMGLKGWRPTSCPSGMAGPSPSPCAAIRSVCMHLPCNMCVCVFVCVVRAPIATPVRGHSWSVVWHACCLISVGSRNVSAQAAGVKASHSMPLAS